MYLRPGDRNLRYALLDLGLDHVRHPRSMSHFIREVNLAHLSFSRVGLLQVTAVRRSRSGDETPFVRTHVGMYFSSLLVCNLAQAVGALLNIPWIVEKRIYVGTLCTTQAIIQQIGSVRVLCSLRRRLSSDTLCLSGWNSDFRPSNRRTHLQPALPPPSMAK